MIVDVVLPIVVILVLVAVNGVFVAAEFAIVGARRSRLQTLADEGSRVATQLVKVFDDPTGKDRYIAIAQLGITLASIGLGMYGEPAVAHWLYGPFEAWGLSEGASHVAGFIVALSGITYMHVVFGEMIPKALALQAPERTSMRTNPVMRVFGLLFRPLVRLLNGIALGLMRALRIPEPDKSMSLHTAAELEIVTDEAAESGQLGHLQRDLIGNILDLEERRAEELMTPRAQLQAVDVAASADEVTALVDSSPRSRYPVVDGDLDHVVGVLHVKDVIHASVTGGQVALRSLARRLPTVTASASAELLLERFKREQTHAALVVDEFGGTLGLVTLDDVIADVMDEPDATDTPDVVRHDDGSVSVAGRVTLSDLADHHGLTLHHPDATTIAGLALAAHGTVPEVGAVSDHGDWTLEVEAVDGRRIARVRVRALEPS